MVYEVPVKKWGNDQMARQAKNEEVTFLNACEQFKKSLATRNGGDVCEEAAKAAVCRTCLQTVLACDLCKWHGGTGLLDIYVGPSALALAAQVAFVRPAKHS